MTEYDFSRYDRVVSPVILYTPRLSFLYANPAARRQYPVFAAGCGAEAYCDPITLNSAIEMVKQGSIALSVLNTPWSLILDPVRDEKGQISYVGVSLDCGSLGDDGIIPLRSDSELLQLLTDEFAKPASEVLSMLRGLERNSAVAGNPTLSQAFLQMRRRMVRMSMFLNSARDAAPETVFQSPHCNADSALDELCRYFEPLKYHATGYIPVPMSRDAFVLAVTDLLTALYFRLPPETPIHATASRTEDGSVVSFRASHLQRSLDERCDADLTGVSTGLFSIRQRIRSIGGDLSVKYATKAATCQIDLIFPPMPPYGAVRVEQPNPWNISAPCALAYEFLMLLSEERT